MVLLLPEVWYDTEYFNGAPPTFMSPHPGRVRFKAGESGTFSETGVRRVLPPIAASLL